MTGDSRPWAPNVSAVRFSPARLRSWIYRIPFCTRTLIFIVTVFWIASLILSWIPTWAALIPADVSIWSMHRLNTYPLVHTGFLHTFIALVALVPLLDRFEAEHGTLVSLALFSGPFATIPGIIYIVVDHVIFRANNAVQGATIWVFLLLSCEAIKTYRANPSFSLGPYNVPTHFYPFVLLLILHFLNPGPSTSILANLCGCLVGYAFELGYLKILIPPERGLRWVESKLNLLGRLPHYVSVDQKTYGRYGVLPTDNIDGHAIGSSVRGLSPRNFAAGSGQRLGP